MDKAAALGLRMTSLLLRGNAPGSVAGIVEWFGAMQAQDVNSGLWSLGCRLPGSTLADVNAALEDKSVLRTWPMRGTVHFVPSADVHWMLELMGVRALAGANKRRETLGLDEATVDRAVDILGDALKGGRLTRAECLAAITDGGVEVTGQRGYHLLWYSAQRGVTAIAPHVGKEQTFVLLDEWVPAPNRPAREEALGIIALRYFRSHGPATLKDFVGWTGLTVTDCRAGIAENGDALATVDVDGTPMFAATALLDGATPDIAAAGGTEAAAGGSDGWLALPGFDEFMLGYKDRSLMTDNVDAIVPGGNGVFRSTLVQRGRVRATWTRTLTAKGVTVTVEPLTSFTKKDRDAAAKALDPYAAYLGLPLTVKNP
ncbi:winged helix DNA-binding domain-containing protein [Actinoplanes bogorensis]|uniref:Winged helix DNA-binding domain-containing protein n=1 Tax=Paractinoplanes bogorensis TaxID=1610840 RepID=A0ABS5Z1I1_9ACTN|nr:winged helix DNA-binding domain-containing protein [Actinoplanes bogorensis]MBU2669361.1 winged helix DNA-binding domain-containing protein [Actinoplanes bogorensis]